MTEDGIEEQKIFIHVYYSRNQLKIMLPYYSNLCKYNLFKFTDNNLIESFIISLYNSNISESDIGLLLERWYGEL